jgi:DNA-binding PadR family transcriptional regulator
MCRMCGEPGARHAGRGWWAFDPGAFWFGKGRRQWGQFRGGRMFGQGDLKYVVLQLLSERPRHGYDIIKELEERFGGAYAPSAGTVYPTLSLLEDLGYARVTLEEGGRKVYSITDAGREYLEENRNVVADLFERMAELGASFLSEDMMALNRSFGRLARSTYARAAAASTRGDRSEVIRRVSEILDEASQRIEALEKAPPAGEGGGP